MNGLAHPYAVARPGAAEPLELRAIKTIHLRGVVPPSLRSRHWRSLGATPKMVAEFAGRREQFRAD